MAVQTSQAEKVHKTKPQSFAIVAVAVAVEVGEVVDAAVVFVIGCFVKYSL